MLQVGELPFLHKNKLRTYKKRTRVKSITKRLWMLKNTLFFKNCFLKYQAQDFHKVEVMYLLYVNCYICVYTHTHTHIFMCTYI